MRRTVTLDVDSEMFSKAFRTMSGSQAKEMLVMLACGGHAVSSHSASLSEIGIFPTRPLEPCLEQACTDAKIARATKEFLATATPVPSVIFAALADRPKPGCKQKAQEAFTALLGAVYRLRRDVEYAKPPRLVGSGDRTAKTA